jgi:hypothetical protein
MSRRRRLALALLACGPLTGCADFTLVVATPAPSASSVALPPIGYNHRYGNDPVAAQDGFTLERAMFAQMVYWEVAIHTDPASAGYVDLGRPAAVTRARHLVTSILLVVATEVRGTITGLLAYRTHAGQEMYAESLLNRVRAFGYDSLTKAQVLIFFTESDEHASLSWTAGGGYTYAVYDDDLQGSNIAATPSQTPLPTPRVP